MDTYTIIEDIFGDENQISASRGFVGKTHVPDDLRPHNRREKVGKVAERPDIPNIGGTQGSGFLSNPGVLPPGYQHQQQQGGIQLQDPRVQQQMMLNDRDMMYNHPSDLLQCRDVFQHVENCPICSSYFKKDVKFYWLIICILIIVILILTRGNGGK